MPSTVKFIFTLEDGTEITHTIKAPDWGNVLDDSHGFTSARTRGGAPKTSRLGGRFRRASFDFTYLTNADKIALSNLFGRGQANGSEKWFYFEWPTTNGKSWIEPIFPNANDGTDVYNPGDGINPGEHVATTYVKWRCKLSDDSLVWTEIQDEYHALSLSLDIFDEQPVEANF